MNIVQRSYQETHRRALVEAGIHPLLAKIYAARSIRSAAELAYSAAGLLPPTLLKGIEQAATLLADAMQAGKRLLIIADATRKLYADAHRWDMLMQVAQAEVGNKDYVSAATLLTGLLTNIPNVDA